MRVSLVAVLVLALSASLSAIVVTPLSFAELVDDSMAIVHGRVTAVHGQWTADRRGIESLVTIAAADYFKGDLGPRVVVRVPGGEAGGFVNIIPGAPRLAMGDEVVLFLKAVGPSIPVVTGTTQGVYRVASDVRSGRSMVVPPLIDSGPARLVRGDAARRPLSLEAFRAAIAAAGEAR